jgi:hypothetical protein
LNGPVLFGGTKLGNLDAKMKSDLFSDDETTKKKRKVKVGNFRFFIFFSFSFELKFVNGIGNLFKAEIYLYK